MGRFHGVFHDDMAILSSSFRDGLWKSNFNLRIRFVSIIFLSTPEAWHELRRQFYANPRNDGTKFRSEHGANIFV